jgi:hypothetical protein
MLGGQCSDLHGRACGMRSYMLAQKESGDGGERGHFGYTGYGHEGAECR